MPGRRMPGWVWAAVFGVAIGGLADLARDARAAGGESAELRPSAAASKGSLGRLDPDLLFLPPSAAGWPGEWRNSWDLAPYLAFHEGGWAAGRDGGGAPPEIPTPNQSLYDVRYYNVDITVRQTAPRVAGTVSMRSTVLTGPLSQMDIDLASSMALASITSNGNPATFTRAANVVTVTLDRSYATGESVTLLFTYSGSPSGGYFNYDSFGGAPMIWTLSEPFGARTWWPCKDYSEDKADSLDLRVLAPTGLRIAANGVLREEWDDDFHSFAWWHEGHPIASYLVSLAIHSYAVLDDVYHYGVGQTMPLRFYDFPADAAGNQPVNLLVKDQIAALATKYGEYPFVDEKYGHAEFLWGGGMEHQTCTSMGFYAEGIAAHELGHQWWGDNVTCKTFNDVWLNEGFATYSEALWYELRYGPEAYMQDMLSSQYFGPGTIYVPTLTDFNRIFDSNLSYNKASWVLHMLRHVLGDATFFNALAAYRGQFQGGSATTTDFKNACESVSGLELDPFFNQWIYGEYFPIYAYTWSASPSGGGFDVQVTIQQTQTGALFTMPIDVTVKTASGGQTFVVQNALASQNYVLHVSEAPTDVLLDSGNWILRVVLAPLPTPSFDRPTLLVNGVDWSTYGSEITTAYQDKIFSSNYPVDFWDYFAEPGGGYPSTLPAPLGHGNVPGEVLAHYRDVIWVGNNFNGDVSGWLNAPMLDYLRKGGNVLLLSRLGEDFLIEPYRSYLGVTWAGTATITDCVAAQPGLTNITRLGTQSLAATFNLAVGANATLLYRAEAGFNPDRGIGVIQIPPGGGTFNPNGGRFCFLSGRPYRWNHAQLKSNVEFILANYLGKVATGVGETASFDRIRLETPVPNPAAGSTSLRFAMPQAGPVSLHVHDLTGRLVRTLLSGASEAGEHSVVWDGRDDLGKETASGIYFVRMEACGQTRSERILRVR